MKLTPDASLIHSAKAGLETAGSSKPLRAAAQRGAADFLDHLRDRLPSDPHAPHPPASTAGFAARSELAAEPTPSDVLSLRGQIRAPSVGPLTTQQPDPALFLEGVVPVPVDARVPVNDVLALADPFRAPIVNPLPAQRPDPAVLTEGGVPVPVDARVPANDVLAFADPVRALSVSPLTTQQPDPALFLEGVVPVPVDARVPAKDVLALADPVRAPSVSPLTTQRPDPALFLEGVVPVPVDARVPANDVLALADLVHAPSVNPLIAQRADPGPVPARASPQDSDRRRASGDTGPSGSPWSPMVRSDAVPGLSRTAATATDASASSDSISAIRIEWPWLAIATGGLSHRPASTSRAPTEDFRAGPGPTAGAARSMPASHGYVAGTDPGPRSAGGPGAVARDAIHPAESPGSSFADSSDAPASTAIGWLLPPELRELYERRRVRAVEDGHGALHLFIRDFALDEAQSDRWAASLREAFQSMNRPLRALWINGRHYEVQSGESHDR